MYSSVPGFLYQSSKGLSAIKVLRRTGGVTFPDGGNHNSTSSLGTETLPHGVEVFNLATGAGKLTDVVQVHYRGTLLDGKEFDSSYKRNQPAEFALNRVIPGWTEGLQLMSAGDKFIFKIPPELAYGNQGAGAVVPPNATLIFTVELISFK